MDWSAVEVTEKHSDALRSYLLQGPDSWVPLQANMATDEDAAGYMSTLYAAFAVAAQRRFSPSYTAGHVVRFVADLRAAADEEANPIDPLVAEDMIRNAIGAPPLKDGGSDDPETVLSAQITVLMVLVAEAAFDDTGLEEFIGDSVQFARDWVAARQGESHGV